jgi:hypothetical protein
MTARKRQDLRCSPRIIHQDTWHEWCSDIDGRELDERGGDSADSKHHDQLSPSSQQINGEGARQKMEHRRSFASKTETGRSKDRDDSLKSRRYDYQHDETTSKFGGESFSNRSGLVVR